MNKDSFYAENFRLLDHIRIGVIGPFWDVFDGISLLKDKQRRRSLNMFRSALDSYFRPGYSRNILQIGIDDVGKRDRNHMFGFWAGNALDMASYAISAIAFHSLIPGYFQNPLLVLGTLLAIRPFINPLEHEITTQTQRSYRRHFLRR